MVLWIQTRQLEQLLLYHSVPNRHDPTNAQHGQQRAQSDAQQRTAKQGADQQGAGYAAKIKAVLAEAQLFAAADGNAVYNAVAGIWNQLHVHRGCRADAGERRDHAPEWW